MKNLELKHNITTGDMLSHHDLVFRSPVCDPMYGLPLGDGSMGTLLWFSENTLHVQINHTDFVDDCVEGKEYCTAPESQVTFCRNGGVLDIKFPCPAFETIYQDDFEARLSLGNATAEIKAKTPFSNIAAKAFASQSAKVTVLTLEADFAEESEVRSELNRWGSRVFRVWFCGFGGNTSLGLDGTSTEIADGCMCIMQVLHGTNFCIAVKPVSENIVLRTAGAHVTEGIQKPATHVNQTYYITAAVGECINSAKNQALKQIKEAEEQGVAALYETHKADWAAFWNKSYVSLPEEQDYVENLWYLNLYYANCQMKGEYPAHFCNGVWGAYHDFVPWSHQFHYNLQQFSFSVDAANHPELAETYYRFRRDQLPYAREYAKNIKQSKGAFYTDVCDLKGRMDLKTSENCTPGAQIAMAMYQHYRYTGDESFLEEAAMPLLRETAEFYLDNLKLGEDGYYHIYETSNYESPILLFEDSVTDIAMIRALFGALIILLPEEEGAPYRERLEKIAPYRKTNFYDEELDEEGRFLWGIGKGKKAAHDHVLSVGSNPKLTEHTKNIPDYVKVESAFNGKECARRTFGNPEHIYYGFPDIEMAPVFPSGTVGIRHRGTELYNMIYNSICLHPEVCMGWCMMPIYLARMGLSEMLKEQLERTISKWMIFPQGFGAYDLAEQEQKQNRWMKNNVTNRNNGEGCIAPQWKFRHFDYETLPIIATSVNEMLLQSYDGVIRLFPAITPDSQTAFKLAAIDGRMVEAVYQAGECNVRITCSRSGKVSIAVDNINGTPTFYNADSKEMLIPAEEKGIYTLDVTAGTCIVVKTDGADSINVTKDYSKNMDVKHLGNSKLGTEKEF